MSSASALSLSVLDWCRETLGNARRPWGIDHFDVAIAVPGHAGNASSLMLEGIQAAELYSDELSERLDAFLRGHHHADAHSTALIAAALFSWGDAAHRALPPM